MSVINHLRAVHYENHKNYFDRMRMKMQTEKTKINSAPKVRKQTEKRLYILRTSTKNDETNESS